MAATAIEVNRMRDYSRPGDDDPLSSERTTQSDHDLLIRLQAEMRGMREDVREIKVKIDDTKWKDDCIKRVGDLENWRWKVIGISIGASAAFTTIAALIIKLTA